MGLFYVLLSLFDYLMFRFHLLVKAQSLLNVGMGYALSPPTDGKSSLLDQGSTVCAVSTVMWCVVMCLLHVAVVRHWGQRCSVASPFCDGTYVVMGRLHCVVVGRWLRLVPSGPGDGQRRWRLLLSLRRTQADLLPAITASATPRLTVNTRWRLLRVPDRRARQGWNV